MKPVTHHCPIHRDNKKSKNNEKEQIDTSDKKTILQDIKTNIKTKESQFTFGCKKILFQIIVHLDFYFILGFTWHSGWFLDNIIKDRVKYKNANI